MSAIGDKFSEVYRDYATDGVKSSGPYNPEKSEQREIGALIEVAISNAALGALVDVAYTTRAELEADLAHEANSVGLVYADPVDANTDLYVKSGASGTGNWTNTGALHSLIDTIAAPYVADAEAAASLVTGALPLLGRAEEYGISSVIAAWTFASQGSEALFASAYFRSAQVPGDEPGDLPGWAFARAAAVFQNVNGTLALVAADTPRIAADGLQVEREASNLALYSSDRTNAAWTALAAVIVADAIAAPDGTITADKLVETSDNTIHRSIQAYACSPATHYVCSEYAKAGERTLLRLADYGGSGAVATFDLAAGTVVSGPGVIEAMVDGWYRCSLLILTAAGQATLDLQTMMLDAGGNEIYAGDDTSGLYLGGAQVEAGKSATSYIPTAGAPVSRPADVASYAQANSTGGAILVEATPGVPGTENSTLAEWSDGTEANRVVIAINAEGQLFVYLASGGANSTTYFSYPTPGVALRFGVTWYADGFRFFLNGAEVGSANLAIPTLTQVNIGSDYGGMNALGGTVAKVVTFSPGLSITEMSRATALFSGNAVLGRTIKIAGVDSAHRNGADLVCDGDNDQIEINQALASLTDGGLVELQNGRYLVSETTEGIPVAEWPSLEAKGAILMPNSNVTLKGQSRHGTIIRLADDQFCNVIRWIGFGIEKTAVRSLTLDPNVDNNLTPDSTSGGDAWLENCGIKTLTLSLTNRNRGINIDDIHVERADGLGVYLMGDDAHLKNSSFRTAVHDMAELCYGTGGSIKDCTFTVEDGEVGYYGAGTDQFDHFEISGNLTIIKAGGYLGTAHRLWPGKWEGTLGPNVVRCEPGGRIGAHIEGWAYLVSITGGSYEGHIDQGGWGATKIELNSGVGFTGALVRRTAFITQGGFANLPTIAVGKTRITQNILEGCTPAPAHAQLVWADNDEFTLP
ncbi:hypothetical protein A3718_08485 [Erythrobacter sp. HI0019]|uniref:phage head spike fiber domain-containing protein n=1 Tax=unclassified Erythrobacter TaxID=2633097 RepID=UPI0007B7F7FB|nr:MULTISPECIES: hypothetical protein [unclassified Erythrobacter]KZX93857.1 hypothetical protein A3718_08485 [Erythrobacter sp. HI0019]KZY09721.1 hypothetical protein A3723_01375 [Erythrobacter sp. HI0028]